MIYLSVAQETLQKHYLNFDKVTMDINLLEDQVSASSGPPFPPYSPAATDIHTAI